MKTIATALALSLVTGCANELASVESHSESEPSVIDTWNAHADVSIVTVGRPTRAEYHFALVHAAMFDAANAIDGGFRGIVSKPSAPAGASVSAAIAQAARDTLVGMFPAQQADLDAKLAESLAQIPDGQAKSDGIAVGQAAAAPVLTMLANSGFGVDRPEYYVPLPAGAGTWVPNSGRGVAPWIGHVQPFSAANADFFAQGADFAVPGPADLASAEWAAEFNETKAVGASNSTIRTTEQTNLGVFWAENTPRIWNRALVGIAGDHGLDQLEKARLYAQAHVAGADATIACWASKYSVQFWRPQTAVRSSFDDGNPATQSDPTWTPFRGTPNHPEYPSGHACFTGAFERTLVRYFGTDNVTFTVVSKTTDAALTNNTLVYHSFSEASEAVNDSRIYLGFHFRSAQEDGTSLGRAIGQHVASTLFKTR